MNDDPRKASHVDNPGAVADRVAAWERRTFSALRRHADLVTVVDDELPELGDWLADR